MIYVAIGCFLACIGLFKYSSYCTIDASPVGSMMILAGITIGIFGVFFSGVAVGHIF